MPLTTTRLMVRPPSGILRKILLGLLALVILALCAGIVLLKSDFVADKIRDIVVKEASEALNAKVTIGKISLKLLPTSLVLQNVALQPNGSSKLLSARRIEVRVRPLHLLRKRVTIEHVIVDGAEVTLHLKDGQITNLPKPKPSKGPSEWVVSIAQVELREAAARLVMAWSEESERAPLRKALSALAAAQGRHPPRGAVTMLARLTLLDIVAKHLGGQNWGATVKAGAGRLDAPGLSERLARLRLSAKYQDGDLLLDYLELGLGQSEVALLVTGKAENLLSFVKGKEGQLEARVVVAAPVSVARRFVPKLPQLKGGVSLDADVTGTRIDRLTARGRVLWRSAELGGQRLGGVGLRFVANTKEVRFSDARLQLAGGSISGAGRVLLSSTPTIEANLDLREIRLSRVMEMFGAPKLNVDLTPTGTVRVRGRVQLAGGQVRPILSAQTSLSVRNFVLLKKAGGKRILAVPSLSLRGRFGLQGKDFQIEGAVIRAGATQLLVSGAIGNGRILLDVDGTQINLADLGRLNGMSWGGRGRLRARVRGRLANPLINGNISLRRASFAEIDLNRVNAMVDYANGVVSIPVATASRGRTRVAFGGLVRINRPVPEIEADVDLVRGQTADLIRLLRLKGVSPDRYAADMSGEIKIRGSIRRPHGWGNIRLTNISVYGEPIHEILARGAYTDAGWAVDQVTIKKSPTASPLELYGVITPAGELSFVTYAQGFSLSDLGMPELRKTGLTGEMDLHAVLQGTLEKPEANGGITLRKMKLGGVEQQDSALRFRLYRKRVQVEGKLLGSDIRVNGEATLAGAIPFNGNIDLSEFEFSSLFKGESRNFFGKATGRGEFSGMLTKPKSIRGKLELSQLVVDAGGGYTVKNRRNVLITVEGTKINVESLEVAGRDTELSLRGSRLATGELDFNAEGRVDLRVIGYLAKGLKSPAGRLEFKSRIAGTVDAPSLLGSGKLVKARVGFANFPHDLRDVSAKLLFTQNKVVVQDLEGEFSDGKIHGRGDVTLERFVPRDFRFTLGIDETRLQYPPDFPSRVAGTLLFTGNMEQQRLTGTIRLIRARYTKDVKLSELLLKKKRSAVASVYEKKREHLQIAIRVVAPDDIRIINNIADLEFQGEINVRGSNRRIGLVGGLRLARQGKLRLRRNLFKVERAFVVFKEGDKIDPYLDIEGTSRVRNYDIVMTIKGPLSSLKINYTCGAGLTSEDCLILLQTGMTWKELNAYQQGAGGTKLGISTAIDAFGAVTGFDEKLMEALPVFDTFQIASGYSQYSSSVVPLLTIGKQVSKYVNLYGTTSLLEPSKDFRARAEMNLSKSLSLTLEYLSPPRTSASTGSLGQSLGNVGLDLRWRYEF